jgi:hypothetical protein
MPDVSPGRAPSPYPPTGMLAGGYTRRLRTENNGREVLRRCFLWPHHVLHEETYSRRCLVGVLGVELMTEQQMMA